MSIIKERVKEFLMSLNIEVRLIKNKSHKVVDYLGKVDDPIRAIAFKNRGYFVIEVKPIDIRTNDSCGFRALKSENPWIDTASLIAEGKINQYLNSPLFAFLNNWKPKTAHEYHGITISKVPSEGWLSKEPIAVPLPWIEVSTESFYRNHIKGLKNEAKQLGINPREVEGWACCGPVSNARGEIHFLRLQKIISSIAKNGYIRNAKPDGDIGGTILLNEPKGKPVFLTHRGGHRISALAASEPETIPIRLSYDSSYLIKRWESKHWGQVKLGVFSEDEALEIFDRIYKGNSPIRREG